MSLQTFADETPLHGLAFATKSISKFDFTGWLVMVLLCVSMTVHQTVLLVNLYNTEPTAVSISYKIHETMILDQVVINIPYSNYMYPKPTFNITLVQELLNNTDFSEIAKGSFRQDSEFNWDLIQYLLQMFRQIAVVEESTKFEPQKTFLWSYDPLSDEFDADRGEVYRYLQTAFHTKNISLDHLLKATLSRLCTLMFVVCNNLRTNENYSGKVDELSVQFEDCKKAVCAIDNVAYFDEYYMAFKIGTKAKPIVLAASQDVLTFTFDLQKAFGGGPFDSSPTDDFYLYFDGSSYASGNKKAAETMMVPKLHPLTCAVVKVRSAYSFLNLRRKPCAKSTTKFDCDNFCAGQIVRQKCNCWPINKFAWKPDEPELSFCGDGTSANISLIPYLGGCANVNRSDSLILLTNCQSACLPQCHNREYDVIWGERNLFCKTNDEESFGSNTTFTIQLNAASFSYSFIEETLLKDWQTFLNEFGGLIGVWLGGSLIAFVHIPMFLLKTAYVKYKTDRSGSADCR